VSVGGECDAWVVVVWYVPICAFGVLLLLWFFDVHVIFLFVSRVTQSLPLSSLSHVSVVVIVLVCCFLRWRICP
jgi:hypothetical protein